MKWSEKTQLKLLQTIRTYIVIRDEPVSARELWEFLTFNKKLNLPEFINQSSMTRYLNDKIYSKTHKGLKSRKVGRTWYYEI